MEVKDQKQVDRRRKDREEGSPQRGRAGSSEEPPAGYAAGARG